MSRFDATALLAAVDAGHPPSDARIFTTRRGYFVEQAFLYFFLSLMCIFLLVTDAGGAAVFFMTGMDIDWSSSGTWIIAVLGFLFLLLVLGVGYVFCVRMVDAVRGIWNWRVQVLVLAPNGFVARTGTQPHAIFAVAYADLTAISLSIQHARYETLTDLLLTYRYPVSNDAGKTHLERLSWRVDPRFGSPATIAQAILEAHTRAMVQRSATE